MQPHTTVTAALNDIGVWSYKPWGHTAADLQQFKQQLTFSRVLL
jgi:hypothetical protein